ncbi:MAG: type IV pilus assembly protein PilO [Oceanicoccus sp.]|jgi:type IV pilus assembly protein PilO
MSKGHSSQLISIILLFVIILGSVFFVVPIRDNIEDLFAERELATEDLLVLQTEYDNLSALAEEISKSEATQDALKKAVPVGVDQDSLILELTELAEGAGFNARVMSFSLRTDQDFGNTLGVSLSLNGAYDDLIVLLQEIEGAERLMQVESISVQRTSTEEITFSLNIEAYYQ